MTQTYTLTQEQRDMLIEGMESGDVAKYVPSLALLRSLTPNTGEPVAVFHGLVDSGEHGAFNLDMLKMIPRGAKLYTHPAPSTKPDVDSQKSANVDDKPADTNPRAVITSWNERPEVLAISDDVEWSDAQQNIVDGAKAAEIAELRAALTAGRAALAQPQAPTEHQLVTGVKAMRLLVTKLSVADFRLGYMAALAAAPQPPQAAPMVVANEMQKRAIAIVMKSGKVSVSEVQRKLKIGYIDSHALCQSLIDGGFVHGVPLAPSLTPYARPNAAPVGINGMTEAETDTTASVSGLMVDRKRPDDTEGGHHD